MRTDNVSRMSPTPSRSTTLLKVSMGCVGPPMLNTSRFIIKCANLVLCVNVALYDHMTES